MTDLFAPRFPLARTGLIGSPIERDDRIQRSPETLWAARSARSGAPHRVTR